LIKELAFKNKKTNKKADHPIRIISHSSSIIDRNVPGDKPHPICGLNPYAVSGPGWQENLNIICYRSTCSLSYGAKAITIADRKSIETRIAKNILAKMQSIERAASPKVLSYFE
jgi:hypothetical protein